MIKIQKPDFSGVVENASDLTRQTCQSMKERMLAHLRFVEAEIERESRKAERAASQQKQAEKQQPVETAGNKFGLQVVARI